jgi:hypothetical protein
MERLPTALDGPVRVAPTLHGDERGFFIETFRADVGIEWPAVELLYSERGRTGLRPAEIADGLPFAL